MAYHWLSLLLRYTRRNEEAYETEKIGYRLDPFLLIHTIGIGQCLLYLGKNDQAIEQFEKATMMSPDIAAGMHWMKSTALASSGNYAGAVEEGKKAVEMEKENPVFGLDLALIYAVAGQTAKATDLLDEILLKANRVYVRLAQVAVVKMALGKEGEGFKWLERAFDEHDEGLLLLRSLPWLRRFWSDPRWVEIERKAGVA
jgi:tetratricopeptide (TPR) repeat protein